MIGAVGRLFGIGSGLTQIILYSVGAVAILSIFWSFVDMIADNRVAEVRQEQRESASELEREIEQGAERIESTTTRDDVRRALELRRLSLYGGSGTGGPNSNASAGGDQRRNAGPATDGDGSVGGGASSGSASASGASEGVGGAVRGEGETTSPAETSILSIIGGLAWVALIVGGGTWIYYRVRRSSNNNRHNGPLRGSSRRSRASSSYDGNNLLATLPVAAATAGAGVGALGRGPNTESVADGRRDVDRTIRHGEPRRAFERVFRVFDWLIAYAYKLVVLTFMLGFAYLVAAYLERALVQAAWADGEAVAQFRGDDLLVRFDVTKLCGYRYVNMQADGEGWSRGVMFDNPVGDRACSAGWALTESFTITDAIIRDIPEGVTEIEIVVTHEGFFSSAVPSRLLRVDLSQVER